MTNKQQTIQIPKELSRLLDKDWREAAVYGGRNSLKSHTVARVLLIRARQEKLRIGCFREFQNSISDSSHQLLKDLIEKYELHDFKVTDNSIVNTVNGSDFLFKGLKRNEQSVKSIEGIDIAWVEEAQTVSEKSLEILTPTVRKKGSQLIYTYNRLLEEDPIHKRLVIEGRPNTLVININYDVAIKYGWMEQVLIEEMEADKAERPKLYEYKWLGKPSSKEGKIYKGWIKRDDVPHEARLDSIGLDYGYTNDPSAAIAIYYYNGGYILDEILFRKGMSNKQIADVINLYLANLELSTTTVADSAEPKSIAEMSSYGVNIIGASKGKDSVSQGIQFVQSHKISVTASSTNLWEGYQNYLWDEDKDGNLLNKPNHMFSDALDAVRYGFDIVKGREKFSKLDRLRFNAKRQQTQQQRSAR